ncbi:Npun_F5749 family FMN-dependent PPOX-type flavoprotein [Aerosakkonema funiforme]|uniref:Pyridoxamine 5'-phosphate oxidase family protein n=1 Tax=Aerosakkonema funiforme FACHB-1375 TaxID=2949571 RepID=A0A926ZIH1_9CYAN|nr:Npun_F5749 family FMN-dependent PPOX-type flavoprotein [Aerosakkonema funiforme]MBD2184418.1 pyridoxamine 5'-phosphate oxidase family protein [Aerosakkonema funiforme FACHB-1375]
MSLAPWRSHLARALHRNRSLVYARYLQLATVRADGRPANRTVVFRGFLEDSDRLKFVTDARSEKAEQIDRQPWAEACWYFPNTREQFRISGKLMLVRENHPDPQLQKARQISWQELSDAARVQFAWPHPGQPRADVEAVAPAYPDPTQPLSDFCLLLLDPMQVDFLELRGEPQNRWLYRVDSDRNWSGEAINP